ncbi:MAG: hypothetical protein HY791_38135 [Deltaproteobacteria bacterium]|nr:hypothetical protein [Deltaproteobacteria bacterium]
MSRSVVLGALLLSIASTATAETPRRGDAQPTTEDLRASAKQTFEELDLLQLDLSRDLIATDECPAALPLGGSEYHEVRGLGDDAVQLRALTRAKLAIENRPPDPDAAKAQLGELVDQETRRAADARVSLERKLSELERTIQLARQKLDSLRAELPLEDAKLERARADLAALVAERELHARRVSISEAAFSSELQRRLQIVLARPVVVCSKKGLEASREELERAALSGARARLESVSKELKKRGALDEASKEWASSSAKAVVTKSNVDGGGRSILAFSVSITRDTASPLANVAPSLNAIVVESAKDAADRCGVADSGPMFEVAQEPEPSEAELTRLADETTKGQKELERIDPKLKAASDALEEARRSYGAAVGRASGLWREYRELRGELARALACSPIPAFRPDRELYPADSAPLAGPSLERSLRESLDDARESTKSFAEKLIRSHLTLFGGERRLQGIEPDRTHIVLVGVAQGVEALTHRPTFAVMLSTWSLPGLLLRRPMIRPAQVAALPPPETQVITSTLAEASPLSRAQPFIAKGLAALQKGAYEQAVAAFDLCLSAIDHGPCHRLLGEAYTALNRPEHAKHHFERYLALSPYAPDTREVRDRIEALIARELPKGVILMPPAAPPPLVPETPSNAGAWLLGAGSVVVVGGIAGLVLASTQLFDRVQQADTPAALDDAVGLRDGTRAIGMAGIAVGAVVLAGGIYLLVTHDDHQALVPGRFER